MQNLLLFLSVAVLAALASLPTTDAAVECYNCVTFKPSWAEEKCKGQTVKGCLFCTKAIFGGSLVVRGCVKAGTEKPYTDSAKICKKYDDYFKHKSWASSAMKKKWGDKSKNYAASCTKPGIKEPKKGLTCKKKLCNAAPKTQAVSSALFIGVIFSLRIQILPLKLF